MSKNVLMPLFLVVEIVAGFSPGRGTVGSSCVLVGKTPSLVAEQSDEVLHDLGLKGDQWLP